MRRLGRFAKALGVLFCLALFCWGCAAPAVPSGKSARAEPQKAAEKGAADKSAPVRKTDRLLSVQIQERAQEVVVQMTGNAPFQDYEFRRLGEDRFALELADIEDKTHLPVLPPPSERLSLNYGDASAGEGIQILGSLTTPLDRYVLETVGNDLILTLYLSSYSLPPSDLGPPPPAYTPPLTREETLGRAPLDSAPTARSKRSTGAAARRPRVPEPQSVPQAGVQKPSAPEPQQTAPGLARKPYTGKPISLDLLDADLRNVLRLLSDITGSNIVIEPDVTGRVTLKVERVPWDQVLDMVLAMNGLGKEQMGNVIRVARQEKLKQELTQQAEEFRAKQELTEVAKEVGELTTVYLTVNYAQPAAIRDKINEVKSERGKVSVDDRTSLIIYSDYPFYIDNARRLLGRLDRATPQVLIEARIVTMSSDLTRSLGLDWNLRFSHVGSTPQRLRRDYQVNSPPGDIFAFTLAEVVGETLMDVDLRLSALETANQLNIMAAPRVLTINHVKAVITQGTQIPFPSRSLADAAVTTTEFKDATLELQVTPHITPDRKVRLEIQAKQDEPTASNFNVGGDNVPGIDTRRIATELLVDDGNIIVIGGVIRNRDTEAYTATPGLHRIPIIGRLFKNETKTSNKTELLIFISPKIVETDKPPAQG